MEAEQSFDQLIQSFKKPLSIIDFKDHVSQYTVIDTRPFGESTGLIKGSYWLPSQTLLSSFLPSFLDPSVSYLLVCQRDAIDDLLECLILMGYMNCKGYNNFDMKKYDGQLEYPVIRNWNQLGDTQKKLFLDVRTPYQWNQTGVIKGAILIELKQLDQDNEEKLELLRKYSGKKLIVTHCRSGNRAKVALSILFRHGICGVALSESIDDFPQLGLKMVSVKDNEQYWKKKLEKEQKQSEQEDQNKAQKQLETDNYNRMQIEECYEECLRNHPEKSEEQCRKQCAQRKRRNQQKTPKMQHSENKNQFQASKMRITPSKPSELEYYLQNLNQQVTQNQTVQPSLSGVIENISQHNYSKASDLLTQMIAKNPDNSNFYINRAMCHIKLNQKKEALSDFNEAIQKDHLNFIPYFDLASFKLNSSQTKQDKLSALQNIFCSLSCLYLKRGLNSRQSDDFQKAIDYSPTNLEALAFLSLKMLQKGDFVKSLSFLESMDKLTEHKNSLIRQMIQKIQRKMQSQQKSDNPESSKQLIEGKTSTEQEKLIIEHFGSSQFGRRLVGKSISFSKDKDIDKEIKLRVEEWNKLYSQIVKQGNLDLKRFDQIQIRASQAKSDMNQKRAVWIME